MSKKNKNKTIADKFIDIVNTLIEKVLDVVIKVLTFILIRGDKKEQKK